MTTATLQIDAQSIAGADLKGYHTKIHPSDSIGKTWAFTPAVFLVNQGQEYKVTLQTNFNGFKFDHWHDTGSKSPERTVNIGAGSDLILTAVYVNAPAPVAAAPAPEPEPAPAPPTPKAKPTTTGRPRK